jgi:hypothetical protein
MLCVKGIAMMVVKAGTASVRSDHTMSWMDSRKMTAPIRHRMGPVAMDGMELNRGLQQKQQQQQQQQQQQHVFHLVSCADA